MKPFTSVALVLKSDLSDRDGVVNTVIALLRKADVEIYADAKSLKMLPPSENIKELDPKNIDLLLVVGGDGTILRTVRDLEPACPILSVNRGAVGFLAEMTLEEAPELLEKFLAGDGMIDERTLLSVEALRGREVIFSGDVLNEAVIAQGSISRLVDLRAEVNGEELTTFRSDGLIVSTPTGSTAYSLAAGGPIVHPRMAAMIFTPINPYSFSQKPLVLPGDSEMLIEVLLKEHVNHEDAEVSLTLDGQRYHKLRRGDLVRVKTSPRTVKFLRLKQETFLQTLRAKLKWGVTP